MIDKKLLFVHVPKTAGISISSQLRAKYGFNWTRPPGSAYQHEPLFLLDRVNDISQYHVFAVVRNPFTRAYSYYKHYQFQTNSYPTFEQFLDHVRRKRQQVYNSYDSKIYYNETPFIVLSQSFWVFDSKGKMSLDKLYRFENISEVETDFGITLPKINAGKYSKEDYYNAYNQTNIDIVRHIYLEDFVNFNYSMDFA